MNYILKYLILVIITIVIACEIHLNRNQRYKNRKLIFSFWEPLGKIPGYLRLCIKTWEKFLPDYSIKILDYIGVKKYLGEALFSSIIDRKMALSMQADAIRVALLNKYGGIWMDTDTIILSKDFIKEFESFELAMIGESKNNFQYIGFIFSSNHSHILQEWLRQIIKNTKNYKYIMENKNNSNIWKNAKKNKIKFDYLGNKIIDPIIKRIYINTKKYFRLDSSKIKCFPERYTNNSLNISEKYREFYFKKGDPKKVLQHSKSLILLHNSWTPSKYKIMSEKEFLKQDILLSKLLSQILNK